MSKICPFDLLFAFSFFDRIFLFFGSLIDEINTLQKFDTKLIEKKNSKAKGKNGSWVFKENLLNVIIIKKNR